MSNPRIYTDGSCYPNPGPGGWAAIVTLDGEVVDRLGGNEDRTTNQEMELTAAFRAADYARMKGWNEVTIVTDSAWVVGGATGANGRKAHLALWDKFDAAIGAALIGDSAIKVEWVHIRGHGQDADAEPAHVKFNEMADKAALGGREIAAGRVAAPNYHETREQAARPTPVDEPESDAAATAEPAPPPKIETLEENKERQLRERLQRLAADARSNERDNALKAIMADLARSGLDGKDKLGIELATPERLKALGFHDQSIERVKPISETTPGQLDSYTPGAVAYILPYFGINGERTRDLRVRFLDGEEPKYLQPPGSAPAAYLPWSTPTPWATVFGKKPVDGWVYVIEGEKKSYAMCKAGLLAIGIGGVNSYKSKAKNIDLLPIFDKLPKGSRLRILFDSDGYEFDKTVISWAMYDLGSKLAALGHHVEMGLCDAAPDGGKRGGDDVLVEEGVEGILKTQWLPWKDPRTSIPALNRRLRFVLKLHSSLDTEMDDLIRNKDHTLSDFQSSVVIQTVRAPLVLTDAAGRITGVMPDAEGNPLYATVSKVRRAGAAWWNDVHRHEVKDVVFAPYADRSLRYVEHMAKGGTEEDFPPYDEHAEDPAVRERNYNLWHPGEDLPLDVISLHRYKEAWDRYVWPLFTHCFPDPVKLNYVLGWWRTPIAKPATKLTQLLLTFGPQGTGKTLAGLMMAAAYQWRYVLIDVDPDMLFRKFNAPFAKKQLALIEELVSPDETQHNARSKTKVMITRQKIRLELKGIDVTEIADFLNYYASTNEPENISLPATDRRFIAAKISRQYDKAFGLETFKWITGRRLDAAADSVPVPELIRQSHNAMYALALLIDPAMLTEYREGFSPPIDNDKEELIYSGLNPVERWLMSFVISRQNAIEDEREHPPKIGPLHNVVDGRDLWTSEELADAYNSKTPRPQHATTARAVGAAMHKAPSVITPKLRLPEDNAPVHIIGHLDEWGAPGKTDDERNANLAKSWNDGLRKRMREAILIRRVNSENETKTKRQGFKEAIKDAIDERFDEIVRAKSK